MRQHPVEADILCKKVRRGELMREGAMLAAELHHRDDTELKSNLAPMPSRSQPSRDLDHPAVDCKYLALAIERDEMFVTADMKLSRLVEMIGGSALSGSVLGSRLAG